MERCRALAELEMGLGFRSSFNFVPEGQYDPPSSLRSFLVDHGFEVGVHDLHHDGTLYRSKAKFSAAARRINKYLEHWQAVGFRSAFMFHNLEWLKELNVLYDASTFDTDPFEPQPDGANTIFPFWVGTFGRERLRRTAIHAAAGFDSFLVLGEKTNEIWKRKLDWVARHGGMALVNVHPDYMAFGERAKSDGISGRPLQGVPRPRLCTVRSRCLVCAAARRRPICPGVGALDARTCFKANERVRARNCSDGLCYRPALRPAMG